MDKETVSRVRIDSYQIDSIFLKRIVILDFYLPAAALQVNELSLLLINDGQDLVTMDFADILSKLYGVKKITPLFCVGIHCGEDRRNEYGTAGILDYKGRGAKADLYQQFIFEELMPFIRKQTGMYSFKDQSFCGFSLGGLSALDIVWSHADLFSRVGVFSGSLWWRSVSQEEEHFSEEDHRIMHQKIKAGNYAPWLKFFFETGTLDETADRNNNGIIDSIDDTLSLVDDLVKKGYTYGKDIFYLELTDGRHDVATWARAMPLFLQWGWGSGLL